MEKDKVALIDFCGTIVPFQTADKFVSYVVAHYPKSIRQFLFSVIGILKKTRFFSLLRHINPTNNWEKLFLLLTLKGISEESIKEFGHSYYCSIVRPAIIPAVINELNKREREGYELCILSGGYKSYLDFFAEEFAIHRLICSDILFLKGRCQGRLKGRDCMGKEKLRRINNVFHDVKDHSSWFCYSDSESDLSVLSMVGHPVVISYKVPQKWATNRNYYQIIY